MSVAFPFFFHNLCVGSLTEIAFWFYIIITVHGPGWFTPISFFPHAPIVIDEFCKFSRSGNKLWGLLLTDNKMIGRGKIRFLWLKRCQLMVCYIINVRRVSLLSVHYYSCQHHMLLELKMRETRHGHSLAWFFEKHIAYDFVMLSWIFWADHPCVITGI